MGPCRDLDLRKDLLAILKSGPCREIFSRIPRGNEKSYLMFQIQKYFSKKFFKKMSDEQNYFKPLRIALESLRTALESLKLH